MAATPQIASVSAPSIAAPASSGTRGIAPKTHAKIAHPQTRAQAPAVNWGELSVPLAVLGIVMAMITPLPSFLLDVLISANITLSVVVLIVSLYITRPVEFSIFPTSLLLLTLFRLALNISSSRLILIHGNTGTGAE